MCSLAPATTTTLNFQSLRETKESPDRGFSTVLRLTSSISCQSLLTRTHNEMIRRIEDDEASGIIAGHPDRFTFNCIDGDYIMQLLDCGQRSNCSDSRRKRGFLVSTEHPAFSHSIQHIAVCLAQYTKSCIRYVSLGSALRANWVRNPLVSTVGRIESELTFTT